MFSLGFGCVAPETLLEASSSSNLVVEMDIRVGSFRDHSMVIRGNSDTFQGILQFRHFFGHSSYWISSILESAQVHPFIILKRVNVVFEAFRGQLRKCF